MSVKLVNESALGIYAFSWKSNGSRCELSWYPELDTPAFSFWVSGRGRMSPPMAVRNPERFASWPPPAGSHAKAFAGFKTFASAFAEAAEQ